MLKITFSDISVRVIKSTFKSRFILAKTCRKIPPLAKIVDKLLFEGDDITSTSPGWYGKTHGITSTREIEINSNIEVLRDDVILPSEVLKGNDTKI